MIVRGRTLEHQPVQRGGRHRRAAAQGADVDRAVADLVHEVQRRIGAHDEVQLFVVQRQDYAQRLDDRGGIAVAGVALVDEGLINVGLHQSELDAGLVAQAVNVLCRACRWQRVQFDLCLRRDELGEIAADLDVGTALRRGNDLVGHRGLRARWRRQPRQHGERAAQRCPDRYSQVHGLPPCDRGAGRTEAQGVDLRRAFRRGRGARGCGLPVGHAWFRRGPARWPGSGRPRSQHRIGTGIARSRSIRLPGRRAIRGGHHGVGRPGIGGRQDGSRRWRNLLGRGCRRRRRGMCLRAGGSGGCGRVGVHGRRIGVRRWPPQRGGQQHGGGASKPEQQRCAGDQPRPFRWRGRPPGSDQRQ